MMVEERKRWQRGENNGKKKAMERKKERNGKKKNSNGRGEKVMAKGKERT
jgi:hypothetical protein